MTAQAKQLFSQLVEAMVSAGLHPEVAEKYVEAKPRFDDSVRRCIGLISKTAVAANTPADAVALQALQNSIIGPIFRARSIALSLPFQRVPLNTRFSAQDGATTGSFVVDGEPAPISAASFASPVQLQPKRVDAYAVQTVELTKLASRGFGSLLAADLAKSAGLAVDAAFLNLQSPDAGAPEGIVPAANIIPLAGTSVAAWDAAIYDACNIPANSDLDLSTATWVCSPQVATYLCTLRGAGRRAYPDVTPFGGVLNGIPVRTTSAANPANSPAEYGLYLLVPDGIVVAEGNAEFLATREATLQLNDAPASGAQAQVSLWQNGLVAVGARDWVNWTRRSDSAAVAITINGLPAVA